MRWFLLLIATVAQAVVSAIRLGIPALIPFIQGEFALERAQVGLISSFLNGGAAAAGIPAGKLVDRVGERLVIGFGAIASGLVILGVHAATGVPSLLLLLLVTGFLTSVSVPAGGALVNRWFSRQERAMAMGLRQTGVPLGGAVSALSLPPVALLFGWRVALDIVGVIAVAVGILALRLYQEGTQARARSRAIQSTGLTQLLARKDVGALIAYAFLFGGSQWCLLTYLVLYLGESLSVPLLQATTLLAVAQVSGVGGRIGWGILSDRLLGGRRTPAMGAIGLVAIVSTLALAACSSETPFWVIACLVALLGVTLLGWNGLPHVLAPELVGMGASGVATGLVNSAGFLGVLIFPPIFGLIVDAFGAYRFAWSALVLLLLCGLLALSIVHRAETASLRAYAASE